MTIFEDEPVEDAPLVQREPDRRLQRHTVAVVGLNVVVAAACICVVAVATGSVPATLIIVLVILATAVPVVVRHVFPK